MRLTTVILIASLLQVSAASFGQRITLNQKNAQLESIFKEIRKQTGYNFYYDGKALTPGYRVSVSVKNATVEETMRETLKGLPLSFEINENGVTIKKLESLALPDNLTSRSGLIDVKGKVVDSLGNGLPGATVRVKNGKGSTSTDAGGNFVLKNVEEGVTLVVNYLGYLTRELATNKEFNYIQLKLSESKLDEVQIVAYGTTTQRLNTGSVISIKAADIEKQPVNNPLYALQGRVTGLQITPTTGLSGGAVNIRIRGLNTLSVTNSADPLIVIDGLPVMNNVQGLGHNALSQMSGISFINPKDIESIEVLKDADATSIYGSRGANGVILITTKSGKIGKTTIDLSAQHGMSQVPKKIKLLNTEQYLDLRKEAYRNSNIDLASANYSMSSADVKFWDQNRFTDWQDEIIGRNAKYSDFQGSISGGNQFVQYLLSGNFHREGTVFAGNSADERANAHLSLKGQSQNQKFRTSVNISYMNDVNTLPGVDLTQTAITLAPNAPSLYNTDGELNWELFPTGTKSWANPYSELVKIYESKIRNLTSSGSVQYEIIPGLNLKTQFGYNIIDGDSFKAFPIASAGPDEVDVIGSATYGSNNIKNLSIEPQASFHFNLLDGKIDLLAGASYQSTTTENSQIFAAGFTSDALLRNYSAANNLYTSLTNSSSQYKYSAAFAKLDYNLANKYLVRASLRRDGSSRFGPGNQFGDFASIGGAWVFSEENFAKKHLNFLSFGKLRSSYGSSGNDGIGDYAYLERYQAIEGIDPYLGIKGIKTRGVFNPYYGWETTRKFELALELGFLKDRFLLSTSYFKNRSGNQLINYPYASTVGPGEVLVNFPATIQNTGYEFTLNSKNIESHFFSWNTTLNISINRNKLVSFPDIENTSYKFTNTVGKPFFGVSNTYKFSGVNPETGRYEFILKNGETSYDPTDFSELDNGAYIRSNTNPKFYGGIGNIVKYKGLTLDFFFQFTKQLGINPLNVNQLNAGNLGNLPVEYLRRWRKPGDITDIQKVFGRFNTEDPGIRDAAGWRQISDAAFVDASFFRLKNVSLSYKIPDKWQQSMKIHNLTVFMQAQNVFTITPYKGFDPETQSLYSLPPLRTVTAGIQVGL